MRYHMIRKGRAGGTAKKKLAAMITCFVIAVNAGAVCPILPVQAATVQENGKSTAASAVSVTSHKQFVNKIYKLALERESSAVFSEAGEEKILVYYGPAAKAKKRGKYSRAWEDALENRE